MSIFSTFEHQDRASQPRCQIKVVQNPIIQSLFLEELGYASGTNHYIQLNKIFRREISNKIFKKIKSIRCSLYDDDSFNVSICQKNVHFALIVDSYDELSAYAMGWLPEHFLDFYESNSENTHFAYVYSDLLYNIYKKHHLAAS